MASLIITQPDGSEVPLALGDDMIRIGRDAENEVQIDDDSISTFHAEIHLANGRHVLKDLGSTNGVRVNGERVHEASLADGDLLRFGGIRAAYHGIPPEAKPKPEEPVPVPREAAPPAQEPKPVPNPNLIPDGPVPDGSRMRGFGTKKAAKDPEKMIYITIGVIIALVGVAALLISFAMH